MIVGLIELLTPRRAVGWVEIQDGRSAPLTVRVRDRETVLAELELKALAKVSAKKRQPVDGRQSFSMDLPPRLDQKKLAGLTIEAAKRGSDEWVALNRHTRTVGGYMLRDPPLLPSSVSPLGQEREALASKSLGKDFWSDALEPASFVSIDARPVFVVGAARSGTSAIGLALKNGTRYRGFPEGHVLDVAIRLVNAVNAHFEKKDPYISPQTGAGFHLGRIAHSRLQAETLQMLRNLTAGFRTPYWFDKTPTYQMIASVPILAEAWPHAKFIFMKRRGLENLSSRVRKFTRMDFTGSCGDWALIMSAWRRVREVIPHRYIEIDQRDMLHDPDGTAAQVGELLGLDPSETAALATALRKDRPEVTDPTGKIVSDISELGWTEEQVEIFRRICGPDMDAYGYTYDADYRR
jgi:hypothetical protein